MSYLGAIEDIGASPYKIAGDPVVALLAQLNRFAGKSVVIGNCKSQQLVYAPFALSPSAFDDRAASAAAIINWRRWSCTPIGVDSAAKEKWAAQGITNSATFVMNNLAEVTTTIAQVGDANGLAPAAAGITQRDPKMAPPSLLTPRNLLLVGAAVGAFVFIRSR